MSKWPGGAVFFATSAVVDHVTGYFEEKYLEEMPIDMPQLMETLPTLDDAEELAKIIEEVSRKEY